MAHKKGQGSSRNGRDSNPQRLGFRVYEGQTVKPGGIIVLQRGTKFHPGRNVKRAKDDCIFSVMPEDGIVVMRGKYIDVLSREEATQRFAAKAAAKAALKV